MNQLHSLELYGATNNTMIELICLFHTDSSITTVIIKIYYTCKHDKKLQSIQEKIKKKQHVHRTVLTCHMNLFFIIIIWGWRSRWSTRSSGCWSGWAAIVLVIFFPLFNKRAQNLQNNNLGSVSRLACFLDFSVSVKVCVKARAPVSFSSEKSTLFGGPLGPTRLLRRWGWRRRGRALVMSV